MRRSSARASLNAQLLHPNSVAMVASGSSARTALSRYWVDLGLLWLVASVVWFSGQMVDRRAPLAPDAPGRLCGVPLWDLHGRSRSRSFLSRLKCQCCLMTMLRFIRRGRERGLARNPAFQEGTQPREEGGAESQCFSSSLYPRPPEPSNAGEQDPTCNAARRAKATDGTSMN